MNLTKLTLLFCFFTTILCGQVEYPGYIIKTEGDTLRGRITLKLEYIKFKQEGETTKYYRSELLDYGYYANRKFYPKPDEAPPAKESTITGVLTLANGDTLQDFYIHSIRPDVIIGYFEYPKYISYKAEDKEVLNLTIEGGFRDRSKDNLVTPSFTVILNERSTNNQAFEMVDLIQVNDFPKAGKKVFMYAERIFGTNEGFRSYNISSRRPYFIEDKQTTAAVFTGAVAPMATRLAERAFAEKIITRRRGDFDDWIIYKNGEIYNINNARDWKKSIDSIFAGEYEFIKNLEWQNIKKSNIIKVLKAYEAFVRENK